jgi:hypothetical protein
VREANSSLEGLGIEKLMSSVREPTSGLEALISSPYELDLNLST